MGSPLAPVLAKIFMDFHESKWLNEYNLNKSEFYLRYVDDILAVLGFLLQFYRFIYLYIYGILFHSMNKNKEVFISWVYLRVICSMLSARSSFLLQNVIPYVITANYSF